MLVPHRELFVLKTRHWQGKVEVSRTCLHYRQQSEPRASDHWGFLDVMARRRPFLKRIVSDGTAYLTTLCADTGGVLVTHSTDGGRHWAQQTLVTSGGPGRFNDHSTLAAWGHGNVVVTWIPYSFDSSGTITTVPMIRLASSA